MLSGQLMSYLTLGIGLSAVYGLLGVLVSTVQELVTGWLSVRSASLDLRLRSLLADTKTAANLDALGFFRRLRVILGIRSWSYAPDNTASPLYQALMKSGVLSAASGGNQPSYVDKTNFAKALIEAIRIAHPGDANGATLIAQLRSIIEKHAATTNPTGNGSAAAATPVSPPPVPPTASPSPLVPTGKDLTPPQPQEVTYDDVVKLTCTAINALQSGGNVQQAVNDLNAIASTARAWIRQHNTGNADDPQQRVWNALNAFISQSGDDLQQFKTHIEEWFDLSMDRLNGIYTRWSRVFSLLCGLSIAVIWNVNSVDIAQSLLKADDKQQDAIVEAAQQIVAKANSQDRLTKQTALRAAQKKFNDQQAAYNAIDDANADAKKAAKAILDADATELNTASNNYMAASVSTKQAYDMLTSLNVPVGRSDNGSDGKSYCDPADSICSDWVFQGRTWDSVRHSIIGWLITALAISLGSSFWFDTLNSLLDLRSSGTKPKPDPTPAPAPTK